MGLIPTRVMFQNVFEDYSLSEATFVFWSESNSRSYLLVQLGGWMGGEVGEQLGGGLGG